jgi:hypothetical protein
MLADFIDLVLIIMLAACAPTPLLEPPVLSLINNFETRTAKTEVQK